MTTTLENNIPGINNPKIDREIGVVGGSGLFNTFSTSGVWLLGSTIHTIDCGFKPKAVDIFCKYINTTDDDFSCRGHYSEDESYCHMINEDLEQFEYYSQPIKLGYTKITDGFISFNGNSIEITLSPNAYFDIQYYITIY